MMDQNRFAHIWSSARLNSSSLNVGINSRTCSACRPNLHPMSSLVCFFFRIGLLNLHIEKSCPRP